jgi:hypothetical protein
MNFEDFVNNDRNEQLAKQKRALQIREYEVAVISCDKHSTARLKNDLYDINEPEPFLYTSLGFAVTAYMGDKPRYTSSFEGIEIKRTGSDTYKVNDNHSYGTYHNYHMAVYATIDEANIRNVDKFNLIFKEATDKLAKYKELWLKYKENKEYIAAMKKAFYTDIKELSIEAQRECGIKLVETLDSARDKILENHRKKLSKFDAQYNNGKKKPDAFFVILTIWGILALIGAVIVLNLA